MRVKLCLFFLFLFSRAVCAAGPPDLLLLTRDPGDVDVTGWVMSEKLDGVRAYWDGSRLLSRQGNEFAAPAWFTKNLPPFELDGELWVGRGRFEDIVSIVSRDQPHEGWQQITYNIFEVPNAPGGMDARLGELRRYLSGRSAGPIRIIPQIGCRGREHLQTMLKEVQSKGGEGLVVRDPRAPYHSGRSATALKVKGFDDMEGRVVGYTPGKGKYAGMVGALEVEIAGGIRFRIGSGLDDREREHPPPLGSIVTFRYRGLTEAGIPRFATFLRVREPVE